VDELRILDASFRYYNFFFTTHDIKAESRTLLCIHKETPILLWSEMNIKTGNSLQHFTRLRLQSWYRSSPYAPWNV